MLRIVSSRKNEPCCVKQHDITDCGAACLVSVIRFYGGETHLSVVRETCGTDKQGASMLGLLRASEKHGFKATGVQGEKAEQFKDVPLPAIAHVLLEGRLQHYVVVYQIDDEKLTVMDPSDGFIKHYTYGEFEAIWQSKAVLLLEPTPEFHKNKKKTIFQSPKKWILELLKSERQYAYQGVFLGLLVSLFGIATSVYIQKLVDDFIPNKKTDAILIATLLVLFLILIRAGFNFLRQSFLLEMAKRLNNKLIESFYKILLRLKKSFFDTRKTGEFIARMNDSVRIQQSILQIVNVAAVDVIMVIVSLTYVFFVNVSVGWMATVLFPIYTFLVWRYLRPIKSGNREVMQSYALVESNYVDHITGIGVIQGHNQEGLFQKINQVLYERLQEAIYRLGKLEIRVGLLSEAISGVLLIVILGIGSYMAVGGSMTTGELLAIFSILGTLVPSIGRIASVNLSVQQAFVSFERLFEFMALMPSDKKSSEAEPVPAFQSLTFSHIDFRYHHRAQILFDVSFELRKGEEIALVGESGSGKTTIGYLLEKFYACESGEILWNGKNFQTYSTKELRKRIATVPQEVKIFNATVFENITLGEEGVSPEDVQKFCIETGFDVFFNRLPNGLATLVGEEGLNLSGGQKQIIALARALFRKPEVLLLDEASSALDMESEAEVKRILEKQKISTITIAHRLSSIRHVHRIYVMKAGRIIENGSHEELVQAKGYYAQLYATQMGRLEKGVAYVSS